MWLKYEFFPKASDPPLIFGIFEALFSLFPKNFKNNFITVFSFLAHWHLFAFDCFRAKKKCLKTFGSAGPGRPGREKIHI